MRSHNLAIRSIFTHSVMHSPFFCLYSASTQIHKIYWNFCSRSIFAHMASALWYRFWLRSATVWEATCDSIVWQYAIDITTILYEPAMLCFSPNVLAGTFNSHTHNLFAVAVVMNLLCASLCLYFCYTVKPLTRKNTQQSVEWISLVRSISDISTPDSVRLSTTCAQ